MRQMANANLVRHLKEHIVIIWMPFATNRSIFIEMSATFLFLISNVLYLYEHGQTQASRKNISKTECFTQNGMERICYQLKLQYEM